MLLHSKARSVFGESGHVEALGRLSTLEMRLDSVERLRVQLAVVKLCDENGVERLDDFVTAAKNDYRDVLYWAEYRHQAMLDPRDRSKPELLKQARDIDRLEYAQWLAK